MPSGYIEINSELCKDCKLCIHVCPHQLIVTSNRMNPKGYCSASFVEKQHKKEDRRCTGCSLCALCCPEVAIEVHRV